MPMNLIPTHLKRYVVDQNYDRYTAIDQAVWRFIMRQLTNFLAQNAHPCYLDGLEKSGISIEEIPRISTMSENLSKYGWQAVPVSGFIPPAAFMEMQSLGILPIASDMRTLEHLAYTPAPDIVHEAAGHAPILIDSGFSNYLKKYAEVARKAIINDTDLEVYEAIRYLSDLKEDPTATSEQIEAAYQQLEKAKLVSGEPSEAALLARMNWWTAEYGLIGDLKSPKIYGAGLMSSVGESRSGLRPETRKIPFSLECLDFNYDITEPQPQLFVAKDFDQLIGAIDEMAASMAYRTGGLKGLNKAILARTVNTVEFESGIQISGRLTSVEVDSNNRPIYLSFTGPCALNHKQRVIGGQGTEHHAHGFGTPIGAFKSAPLVPGETTQLEFESGVKVQGVFKSKNAIGAQDLILTFSDCTVTLGNRVLFDPSWGVFDMAVGKQVTSVFGGPADRDAFGATDEFVAARVPAKEAHPKKLRLIELYQEVRHLRRQHSGGESRPGIEGVLFEIMTELSKDHSDDWLLRLEIFEFASTVCPLATWVRDLKTGLVDFAQKTPHYREAILDGLSLVK